MSLPVRNSAPVRFVFVAPAAAKPASTDPPGATAYSAELDELLLLLLDEDEEELPPAPATAVWSSLQYVMATVCGV